jgi:hypothetical protein
VSGSIANAAVVTFHATTGTDQGDRSVTAAASVRVVQPPHVTMVGAAVCDPGSGTFHITWTLSNQGVDPFTVVSSTRTLTFPTGAVPGGQTATATETVAPITGAGVLALTVVVANRFGDTAHADAQLTLGDCAPPLASFTFTKVADVTSATLGQTVTYTYTMVNDGAIPLQVSQLQDDQLGVLLTASSGPSSARGTPSAARSSTWWTMQTSPRGRSTTPPP